MKSGRSSGKVLGGRVPGKPDDIPGVGLYTEGNREHARASAHAIEVGGIKLRRNDYEKTYFKHFYNA